MAHLLWNLNAQILFHYKTFIQNLFEFVKPGEHWFLSIALSANIGMHVCVCVSHPEATNNTSGVMLHDIDPIWLVR